MNTHYVLDTIILGRIQQTGTPETSKKQQQQNE